MSNNAAWIVHVHVNVVPDQVDAFISATVANAQASLIEPGVARFDVVQEQDDPTKFVLIEVYRTAEAAAEHKQTAHYQTWRDTVAPMMASPRQGRPFKAVFPPGSHW